MAVKTFPKANFIKLISYWQEHTDFKKLEEDKMLETYFAGMKFFESYFGKGEKTELFPEDVEYMLTLRGERHWTLDELCTVHSAASQGMRKKMYKLITRGYVSSYKEKGITYYQLTPFGEKILIEEILSK